MRHFESGRQPKPPPGRAEVTNTKFDELQLKWEIKPARIGGGWGGDMTRPPDEAETPTPPLSAVEEG